MLQIVFSIFLVSGCDFQSAYNKALEDEASGSYGMNIDRYCRGASAEERKKFKQDYKASRSKAKEIQELGLEEAPSSRDELESRLKNREAIDGKVVAKTEEGAYNKHKDKLASRIKELEAENARLREEIQKIRSGVAGQP